MFIAAEIWLIGAASAEDVTWNNTSTESGQLWSTSSNWSTGQVPVTGDTVTIANGETVDLGISGGTFSGNVTLSNGSIVSNNPGDDNNIFYMMPDSFSMTGGTVDLNVRRFVLGTSGTTTSTISGGTFTYKNDHENHNGSVRVGELWNGETQTTENVNATLKIQGEKTAFNATRLVVGHNQDVAGKSVSGTLVVGDTATVTLGQTGDSGSEDVFLLGTGENATGKVTVKDSATLTMPGTMTLGSLTGTGTLEMFDSGYLKVGTIFVGKGNSSKGEMNIEGGKVDASYIYLGVDSGALGSFTMSKGTIIANTDIYVGCSSAATWEMTGGTVKTRYFCAG